MCVLKIITSFTVAHSLTLGAAVLGAAMPPPRLVESIIAASVVVAALNNLFPLIAAKHMVALTFGFGLIHGFGFANVLQELGLPRGGLILSLVGFNLGVEMGQLAIVGVALPWAYALRHLWVYRRVVLELGSAATAGIALLWFVERAFDLSPLLSVAPGVDLRAELARLAPFVLAHLVHPLIIIGGALLVMLVVMRTLLCVGRRTGHALRWQSQIPTRLVRSGLCVAVGMLVLGMAAAFSAARQDANLMAKAAEIAGRLAVPLREQLRTAEPRDRGYQEQLATVREAVDFLVEQHRMGEATGRLSEVLNQLAVGQTAMAQAYLKEHAEVAMTSGDRVAAAVAQRYQGALALVEDMSTALETYRRAVEIDPQGWHGWTSLAYLLGRAEQHPEAESAARRALELAQAANDSARVGTAYENLGIVHQASRSGEEAEGMYREALNTYRVLGDEPGMARVYSHVGSLYGAWRRFDKAQAMYRDALSTHQRLGDQEGMASDYANLGAIYVARGLFQQGEAMYLEARNLNEALDRMPSLALNYADLARLAQRRGDTPQAELRFRHALAIDEGLNYRPGVASHVSHLGMLYRQAGDLEQAAAMLHRALSIDLALGNQLGLAINSAHLASIYQMWGDLVQAEALYQQALATNELLGREVGKAANYAHLGHIYRQRGELEQAGEMYRKSLALFGESGVTAGTTQVQVWLDTLQNPSPPR
jgi:tetratricopeptide (TPR) repeat protein